MGRSEAMARFDVYRNPDAARKDVPFLLDMQNDVLADLESRVVVPLRKLSAGNKPMRDLQPVLTVDGKQVFADFASMAAVSRRALKTRIGSAAAERQALVFAVDALLGDY
jgi:toxin CcdB